MPGPGVAVVSVAWLIHSSRDLWLPWLEVVMCCQPDTGSLCGWKDAVSPPNCLVSLFLSRLRKQVLSLISRIYCYLLLTL